MIYYLLALFMGIIVVITPVLNGQLTLKTSTYKTAHLSFMVGGFSATAIFLIFGKYIIGTGFLSSMQPLYYSSIIFGVFLILLMNYYSSRIAAFLIVIIPFVGQTITGVLVDYYLIDKFSFTKLIGAGVILIGLYVNAQIEKKDRKRRFIKENQGGE
ncbi:MAG: DMT family transporter [Bacillota bacterium]|nr:DMT family transporter [Bacillota bacterium]